MKNIFWFFIAIMGLYSCYTVPPYTPYVSHRLPVGPGPEDIALDTFKGRNRLIVSCSQRRAELAPHAEIWGVDLEKDSAYIIPRIGEPETPFHFAPHGIDLNYVDGNMYLYVVNHRNIKGNERQSILKYRWNGSALEWVEELYYDFSGNYYRFAGDNSFETDTLFLGAKAPFTTANDVCVGKGEVLYWSNDFSRNGRMGEAIWKMKSGWAGKFSNGKIQAVSDYKMAYPNGVLEVDSDLWVSTVRQHRIFCFPKGDLSAKPLEVARIPGGDNLIDAGEEVLVTAHIKPFKFISHARNAKKESPSVVYAIHKKTHAVRVVYSDSGAHISTASTALKHGSYLYISQIFEGFILKVKLDE